MPYRRRPDAERREVSSDPDRSRPTGIGTFYTRALLQVDIPALKLFTVHVDEKPQRLEIGRHVLYGLSRSQHFCREENPLGHQIRVVAQQGQHDILSDIGDERRTALDSQHSGKTRIFISGGLPPVGSKKEAQTGLRLPSSQGQVVGMDPEAYPMILVFQLADDLALFRPRLVRIAVEGEYRFLGAACDRLRPASGSYFAADQGKSRQGAQPRQQDACCGGSECYSGLLSYFPVIFARPCGISYQ